MYITKVANWLTKRFWSNQAAVIPRWYRMVIWQFMVATGDTTPRGSGPTRLETNWQWSG